MQRFRKDVSSHEYDTARFSYSPTHGYPFEGYINGKHIDIKEIGMSIKQVKRKVLDRFSNQVVCP